jgi:outer membrane receptor protein involved in Fe transport
LVAALLFLASIPVLAQTTGRLNGRVADADGLPLPGVTITIAGEVLMGGTRTAVSGETGAFRFTALPPGLYSVMAELDGFKVETLEGVKVAVGGVATANFFMYPEEFTEAITVSSEAPLVDVTSSSKSNTFSAEFMQNLPTDRNFYDMISVSPGVSSSSSQAESDRQIAFGSDVQANSWNIDGVETSGPETGTSWIGVNPAMVEEIQVMGVGAPAEYGNMLGAAFNVVTKSGTNDFRGDLNLYWFDEGLVDSDLNYTNPEAPEFTEFEQAHPFWDIGATLGGPIMKDRLWFIAGFEYWRDGYVYPGGDASLTPEWYQDRYDLKFSVRFNDKNFLDVKGGYNDWGYPATANPFAEPSALAGEVGDDTIWGFNFQSIFTDRFFLEARYSGWKSNDDNVSQTGSMEPAFIDFTPPGGGPTTYSGGYWYPWNYDTSTDQFNLTMSYFADDFLAGDHDFKFGIQANQGDAITNLRVSETGSYYYHYEYVYDYYGYIYDYSYVKVSQAPYFYGNEQEAWGLFVDDSWAVNDRLTINLGLRYDYSKGIIPSFPRLDLNGNPTGEAIPGIDPVFTWKNWSPRVGFAYNLGANRQTVIRGSFGIYYNANVGGGWNSPAPNSPLMEAYYSSNGTPEGPYDSFYWDWNAGEINVDPNLKAPQATQFSLGAERQFGGVYSIGLLGIYKETTNGIGWEFLNDAVFDTFTFTDPFNGRQYELWEIEEYPTTRKGNKPGYTADGFIDDYDGKYWAAIVTFNRRFADWWSMQASYTYSKSTGTNPRALSQTQNNPLYGSKQGSHPNQWFNVNDHDMQGDRPNMFRVQANFQLPWKLRVSTAINLQDGQVYSRQIRGGYGTTSTSQRYFIADYDLRHDFQSLVDFSIGKDWGLPGGAALKTDLQFFNLLNDDGILRWQTPVLDEGEEFIGYSWVRPRRLMLRLGVEF